MYKLIGGEGGGPKNRMLGRTQKGLAFLLPNKGRGTTERLVMDSRQLRELRPVDELQTSNLDCNMDLIHKGNMTKPYRH